MTRYLPLFIFFMLILGACTSSSTLDAIPTFESLVATPTTASSQTPVPATPTPEVTATPLVEATFTPLPTQDLASLRTHYNLQLLLDYNAHDGQIDIQVRRALIGYVLQQLTVDTTTDHSLNPQANQLVLINRDEIEPFAAWAFQ